MNCCGGGPSVGGGPTVSGNGWKRFSLGTVTRGGGESGADEPTERGRGLLTFQL